LSRQKMYDTNLRVRNYLLNEEKCTDVWFKKHTRRLDKTYTPISPRHNQNGFYYSRDLFNLFDGIALLGGSDFIIFFQAKTTNFPKSEDMNKFARRFPEVKVVAYVARKIKGRIHVLKRKYPFPSDNYTSDDVLVHE